MVRETRHLWVGNLPENIREDRIRDHFKRYGRVQSVKLLPRGSGRGNGNSGGNDNTSSTAGSGGSSAGVGGGGKDEDSGGGTNNTGTGANSGNGTTNNNCQGLCATVSFMDIKSAAKAHHSEQKLDDRTLTTEYHEPAAIPGATSQLYSSSSSSSQQSARFSTSHGSSEEVGGTGFDRSSHFYDRSDGSSGGAGVASGGASGGGASTNASGGYLRRTTGGTTSGTTSAGGYHPSSDVIPPPSSRSRTRERLYRNGPYPPLIDRDSKQRLGEPRKAEGEDLRHSRGVLNSSGRSQASNSSHHRVSSSSWAYDCPSPRYSTNQLPSSTPELPYTDERRENTPVVHKKHSKSSISRRSGSDSGSNSGSSRSRSSSASSQSGSSTCSTASSSPAPSDKSCSTHSQQSAALRTGGAPQSSVSTTHTNSGSPAVHSEDRRPLAICVRNLPARSSDTSLKDGLYHEYKKHGKVTWVKVVGQGVDRYALVCFKKPDDVDKALQVSHDKLFFGCKIEVAPYQGYDVDDNEFRPFEAEQDEFHPKATRTLFIGNLEKDTTAQEIRKHFEQFGEIIDIDVKKQGTSSTYAFCQFSDISSVVRAMRTLDGEHVGQNRIKLGFGKSMHTNSVWVDGVADTVSEKYLSQQFGQFGPASHVVIDRSRGHALVFYEQIAYAQQAVKEMRGVVLRGRKLQVDYASRECQEAFYDRMDKQTNSVTSSSSSFDNSSVQTTTTSSITNLRVFDTASNANTSASNASNNRYSSNSGANTVTSSSASCGITGPGNNRYSGNIGNRTTSAFVRSNSSTGNSPAAGAAQPTVSSINQAALRSTSRPQVNSSSTAQRFDYSTDYVQDRRNYRSYEDGTNTEDPGGGTTGNTSEVRHLQKERISGMLESGGTSPAAVVSSANSITVQEEGRRRCNKHRRSESNSGSTASSNVGADTGSGAPSRPGTPLCDERPENLPVEPRRTPRDRSLDPLSLPLPRFAAQVLSPRGQPVRTSPPASPFSSSDSEPSPPSPEWEERLRSLDERYEKWSGSRSGLTKIDPSSLKIRHKLLEMDVHELPPSDIVKSVLAKRSVFDEDSKRLENFGDKYEPKEFIPAPRTSFLRSTSVSKSSPGLQYPFPSHPPVQPTTSVATTTAPSPSVLTSATEVKPSVTFLNCTRPQHIQPKISSPSVAVVETTRPPAPTALHDKFKTKVKTEQPVKKDIPSPVVTSTLILPSPTISTPPKPKLSFNIIRRDSTDEKSDPVRRKSRDESVTNPAENIGNGSGKRDESNENDKVRDAQVCERRKSVSAVTDKRRSSLDSKAGENVCETSKLHRESTDKKEDRRRGSSEISDHHSTQSNPIVHHKMDTKKVESLTADSQYNCVDIHEKTTRKAPNENLEKRRETVEHSVVRHNSTEVQDKKKEISERDRRRARESTDSSHDNHSSKYNRKVPENKKETELSSATSEKRDDTVNKQNAGEPLSDKKRETLETNQTAIKHREKKEHHTQDKEKRRDSSEQTEGKTKIDRISPDCSEFPRHREQKRTNSDQNTKRDHELLKKEHDVEQKIVKKEQEDSSRLMDEPLRKEADIPVIKHKDSDRRRNSDIEISKEHSLFKKVFGFAESLRLHKERRDSDATSVKTEESGKHRREHSTDKEKRKENSSEEGAKHKAVRRSPDNQDSSRHKEDKKRHLDANNRKIKKENENSDDSKLKDITSEHSEIFHSKSREDKKKEERRDNAASKSLYYNANDGCEQNIKCNRETEKKKDFSSSLIDSKKLDDTDPTEVSKKEIDTKKEADGYYERRKDIHSDVARNRDNERRKSIDKYYENEKYREAERKKDDHDSSNYKDIEKKNDSSVEKFKHVERHRDTERKRDENLENCKTKEGERKRDFDSHERHKSSDKRKDFDGHRLKEEKKSEDGFDASKHKENERKNEEASYDRIKLKDDSYNRFKDYIRKKESDNFGERKKDGEKERRKEREHQDMQPLKECSEERKRENEKDKKRGKDYDMHEPKVNGDHDGGMFTLEDCRKSCITYDENDHRVDSLKKDKRRERNWPATIGCKRRLSSQDSLDISDDQAKRSKPERRDSKDSGRSSGSSRKGSGEKHSSKGFKLLEEKIKEDKEREQRKKEEAQDNSISSIQAEEKIIKPAIRKEKRNSGDKRKEERVAKFKSRPRENGTASESDLGSGDDDAKSAAKRQQHSIFDIVDDEPAYISMYDKVKARSTKNMQKQEEEKRQEKLKEKFHQLKASRAKREEKKRSTSYDEDSDSEKGSCRRNKLLLTSSEEDGGSESDMRMRARKILYDTSEDDTVQTPRARKMYMEHSSENKCNRKIVSDVSEDDTVIKHSTPKIKSSRNISFETDTKSRKIMSDTSEDDAARHNPTTLKLNPSRIQSDESETDLGFEDSVRTEPTSTKDFETAVCDIFNNRTVEVNHFKPSNEHQEQGQQNSSPESMRRNSLDSTASEQPRKKSHKKKQKRQKTFEENEDVSIKKHSSKKEKKKSHRDNDGDEEKKSRKKRSEREGNNKIDEKFEDIFGSLSDDSEKTMAKWQVSQVYDTDSESERENIRKKEKKRREKKLRELDEAGRAIEAKLMESTVTITEEPTKIKKKKRKKSRDEKIKHHQQRVEQEEAVVSILPKEETDQKCNIKMEPDLELVKIEQVEVKEECRSDLPHLGKLEIKIEADSENETKASLRNQSISSLLDSPPPTAPPILSKKSDIPGFGSEVDESIHETAVKSISESPRTTLDDSDIKFDDKIKSEEPPPTTNEEKPTPVISQEETEDAVAALLVDAFGGGFEGYSEDTPKPDTPVSEPDLQIDTDTEDTFDTIDFSKPPRTPDIPASYYTRQQNDTREGLEERIMSLACSAESPLKDNKPLPMPRTPDVVFDKKPATPDIDMSSSDSEKYPDKQSVVKNLSDISHLSPSHEESTVKESNKQQSSSDNKVPELLDQTPSVCNKTESTNSQQKSLVAEPPKITSASNVAKIEDLKKEPEVPKLALLIPQNISSIQTSVPQHNTDIPSLSPITKSSECSSVSQASSAQNCQKLERIQQLMPKPQTTVLVQQPQPQAAQVVKPLSVQVINSSVSKSSEQPLGLQIPPITVHAPKMSSPKQIVHKPPQTQGNLVQAASKQSNVVQNKPPSSKTIIIQQSPQQVGTGLAQAKTSSQLNNVQLKPQPAQHNMPAQHATAAQHNMPAQHATAAQHALLKSTVHRLPAPYPPMKSNQNVINAHPHLVQPSTTHLIPIKVNTTQQPQPPIQNTQPIAVPISAKAAMPPLLPTIKDSQSLQQSTPSNNSQKQLHIHVNQQGQHSPHSPQPVMSPQNLKLARPVSTTQPPPLQSISVHHFRTAPHIQQAPPRSPNPTNVPLLQTVNVSGEHTKSSQGYLPKQIAVPLPIVNCHNLMHSPNNQAPHPEKVIALSPSNPFQQQQQPHSPVPFTQKTSAAVNVIKSSSLVSEPTKVTPLQENSLDTNSKEEKNKLASNQSSNQLVQINSLENTEAVVEQNAPVKKTNDESKKPLDTDDSKPLNAVIQDLTLRAASKAMWKQQSSGLNNETNRQETAKPIEQVVLALHKKATAVPPPTHIEPTESEKKDSSLNPEEPSSEIPKLDESSLSEGKTSKHETSNESIISDPQTPKPNTSLDTVSSDSKDQSATSPCERNVPSHTPSPASTTNMFQEKNQKDQNTLEAHKIESQINEPVNNNATENNSLSSSNVSQDKKQSVQIARKSPTPMAEKRSDRKTPPDCSPKVDDGPEAKTPRTSRETPDIQSQADEKAKPDILAPTTPVTTRPNARGGRRRKGSGVGGRGGGGVATRRTRLANSSAPSPISTDVYEFRDDPEEERPRLILTIKSPPEPAASSAVVHTTSVHHESSSASISASTPTTTRKSRRLQEKDGSRTTIDETIDDVVRGNRPGRRTTRSSAHSLSLPSSLQPEATRKSPRRRQQASQQQQQQQQQQQSQLQQSQQPTRQPSPAPSQESSPPAATLQTTTCTSNVVTSLPAPQTPVASGKHTMQQQQVSQASISTMEVNSNNSSPEPTTLIDPVTGLLIPMTESEEGQYVPLHSETNRSTSSVAPSTTTREDGEPAEKRARLSVQPPPVTTTLPQQAASTGQPPPQLPVSQQQPLQQQNSSPVQERAHLSMAVSVVPSPTISTSRSEESVGRTTTAITTAAVTLTACAPPITPSRPSVVRPIASSHSVVAPHGMLLPQGKVVSTQVSSSVVRPSLPITSLSHNTPPPLVASIASTSVNQTRMSSNIPSSTSITAVTGTSISAAVPKAHLLQAANVRPSPPPPLPPVLAPPHGPPIGMPTPVAPKAHLLQVVGSSGTREGVVGSSAPHQGTVLTGSVASPPPLRAHQQPVVTGASSARVLVKEPPPQSSRMLIKDDRAISGPPASARLLIKEDQRNAMPSVGGSSVPSPRVLVKESGPQSAGCIVGIAGSPQPPPPPPPRGQVMQAGMPVPAYEASLGDVVQHVSYGPHHIQPAHYVHPQLMYQQYLREAALGGPYNRPLGGVVKTDLDDRPGSATAAASALVASPPLELRRGSPHDRTTDSPQVATVYMHHNPASRHHVYYDGPPPPPAHRPQPPPSQSTAGRLQTPPHAGQAPPQADSLLMLLQRYPVMWQGLLALKNDQAAVQMHFVFGNHHLAQDSLPHNSDGSTPPLRIAQRMRLEQTQVEGVARKMQIDNEHCMLLALPCGRDHMDVLQQSTNLQNGFITYLQQKQAAGIINIAAPGSQQAAYVVHIFPACEFANESLARIAPDLLHRVADLAHLLIVIATV